mmetsp:Transcript_14130/g.25558  ORF Transcript_14130/g.25558 Transcript_14130/m.25558 type:complete len:223 (+) Transcript_14130:161-829(+)|eukprot:CAMPEP_0201612230 /NCGR_PEP_ID=MMETSP0492-20130828/22487_1 /ASSEMBLY_ACC=CAM_ASM_000837 /TAXON_ID=420259 /ORGANISM="Thalassiosira gravida, Strain GMp14c1" /LENGTH=222 /DNA_ID=CAMNT_0048078679 /DNA_START=30 /DNA_END=698 /DNA_ORIENTATION=+
MLALKLKKKKEAEAKAKAEAEAAAAPDGGAVQSPGTAPSASNKVSLLGAVGGKKKKSDGTVSNGKKRTPGEIRIQKDIAELDGGKVADPHFPNANDLTFFDVSITPDSGFWRNATYKFTFDIPDHYPHSPPKVHCDTKIYHPNINLEGKVCLNILREDWKPVLDVNAVIYGLISLFYEPNPNDPLNHEAAELFRKDTKQFERLVQRTLRGGVMDGVHFEKLV